MGVKMENMRHPADHCILCGCDTGTPVHTDVSLRPCYVEGAGQLCTSCHNSVFVPTRVLCLDDLWEG
jgi:hypothetical protein